MHLLWAVVLSLLQGVSELFPVSSLGHAVILPRLLHWSINESGPEWLAFLVALHIGTAAALVIFFWREWRTVVLAFVSSVRQGQIGDNHDQRLAWMVVLGTIPAGLVGVILQDPLRSLFASPLVAATFLIVNGLVMIGGERLLQAQLTARPISVDEEARPDAEERQVIAGSRTLPLGIAITRQAAPVLAPEPRLGRYRDITHLRWRDAAVVGFAQIGALIPGISRSGVTMVAGLAAGLTHEAAARYAFLLATPIIGAAGLLELPELFSRQGRPILGYAVLGALLAGIAAYLSVRFLMRYFELGRLFPFAYYCVGAGVLSLILLSTHV